MTMREIVWQAQVEALRAMIDRLPPDSWKRLLADVRQAGCGMDAETE